MPIRVAEPDPRSRVDGWPEDATPAQIAKHYTREATLCLVGLMFESESDIVRKDAAATLLAYGHGKPAAEVKVTHATDDSTRIAQELAELRRNPKTAGALLVLAEASASMTAPPKGD